MTSSINGKQELNIKYTSHPNVYVKKSWKDLPV